MSNYKEALINNILTGVDSSGSGSPTGAAGGDLSGTFPNPTVPHATSDGSSHSDVAANTAALLTTLSRTSLTLTFPADASNTIEERIAFPFALSEVESIWVGPIGVAGTGTITFEKGMQGGTNLLTAASYDVSTATDNVLADVGALSGTQANYRGGESDVILISMINCSVPHIVKITFKRE